jgi:hypothetical protein
MKIIISENKLEKLNEFLNSRGPLFVIRMIGGYNNFIKLFPDYFESKENKIKLLNELIENDDELEVNGRIYMSDITEKLILVGTDKTEYGTDLKFYIDYIKEDWATIQVWEFDKNDELVDEDGFDAYDIKFDELDRRVFNQIFESMVNYLLL